MKTSVFVGVSVDGFIARPDDSLDFLHASGAEADNGYGAFFATVDVMVLGRNTFDVVLGFDTWPYGTTPVFVLSTRPLPPAPEGARVERLSGPPGDILSVIAARGYRHAYVDGGQTIQQFLRACLVDRLVVTRVPVLIGAGIPLFGSLDADVKLRHVATRVLAGGAVQSEYAVPDADADSPPAP